MTTTQANDLAKIVNGLAATFDRYGWNKEALTGYMLALSDLGIDQVRQAAIEALRTLSKMPAPAELRRLVLHSQTNDPPEPDEAWAEVQHAITRWGRHGDPEWTHPAIGQALEYIGWVRLCNSHNHVDDGFRFRNTYATVTKRAERDALMAASLDPAALEAQAALPAYRLHHIEEASRWRPALELIEGDREGHTS